MDDLSLFLNNVQEILTKELRSDFPFVNTMTSYVIGKKGKNIRSKLVFFLSKTLPVTPKDVDLQRTAAVLELIHQGTLIHDDIIDQTPMRRNQKAAHVVFGNTCSVLLGDYFFTKAFQLTHHIPHALLFMQELSITMQHLVQGELLQLQHKTASKVSYEDYLQMISLKTSSLFRLACCSVALFDMNTPSFTYSRFGWQFGLFFQMVDDYLDYFGEKSQLGKDLGNDYQESKYTLPIVLLEDVNLLALFEGQQLPFDEFTERLEVVKPQCLKLIKQSYDECLMSLEELPHQKEILDLLEQTFQLVQSIQPA